MIPDMDPRVDYAFKRTFGQEHSSPQLTGLVEAVLEPPPEQRLVDLHLDNPFNDKETPDDKLSILDIRARDRGGRQYNIEMQLLAYSVFCPRALYYWARSYQSQLSERDPYERLRPTISICFVNSPLFAKLPGHHRVFELREQQQQVVFTDHLVVHILELAKFKKNLTQLQTPLDRWLYFLCHANELDPHALPQEMADPNIRRALEVLENMSQSVIDRERYEARQKTLHDMASLKWEAELARQEAELARQEAELALQKGELLGRIKAYQQLLRRHVQDTVELKKLSLDQLQTLAVALEAELTRIQSTVP
jgi:predicted transposase/invertase (TIGR01784 family)